MFLVWGNNLHYLWSSNKKKHKFPDDILNPELLLGKVYHGGKVLLKNISPLCTGFPQIKLQEFFSKSKLQNCF